MIPWWLIGALAGVGLWIIIWIVMSIGMVGFWNRYVIAKLTNGKYVMVKWRSKTGDYWKLGRIVKDVLYVRKRGQKFDTLLTTMWSKQARDKASAFEKSATEIGVVDSKVLYRMMGVFCIDLSEDKNAFCTVDYSAVSGFDEETYEMIIVRALMAGAKKINWTLVLIALGIIILLGAIAIYMINSLDKKMVLEHASMLNATIKSIVQNCNQGGVIPGGK